MQSDKLGLDAKMMHEIDAKKELNNNSCVLAIAHLPKYVTLKQRQIACYIGKNMQIKHQILYITHLAFVSAGPCPAFAVYSLKYWGTDRPINRASPTMSKVLIEFKFTNWRKEMPVAAAM